MCIEFFLDGATHWTGFYMIVTSVMKELKKSGESISNKEPHTPNIYTLVFLTHNLA